MNFAEQLKAARASKGLSQAQAAERIDRSVKTLQNWEGGRNTPHPDVQTVILARLA